MKRRTYGSLLCLLLISNACLSPAERQAALFAQADEAAQAGDLPRAIAKLRAAVSYDPSDVVAARRLAEALVRADLSYEAALVLEQFPADAQGDVQFQNLRVRLLLRFGRVAQALPILLALEERGGVDRETVQAALEAWTVRRTTPAETPGLPGAWRLALVERLIDGKNVDLAGDWLRTLGGDSVQEEDLRNRLLAEVLRAGGKALSDTVIALAEHSDTANAALVMRRHLIANKNWTEVSRIESRFLTDHVGHAAWTEVALAAAWRSLRAGDPLAAERLADRVASLDPVSVEPIVVRGLALRERGREAEARKALELALALDPTNETARRALSGRERE